MAYATKLGSEKNIISPIIPACLLAYMSHPYPYLIMMRIFLFPILFLGLVYHTILTWAKQF